VVDGTLVLITRIAQVPFARLGEVDLPAPVGPSEQPEIRVRLGEAQLLLAPLSATLEPLHHFHSARPNLFPTQPHRSVVSWVLGRYALPKSLISYDPVRLAPTDWNC
jgi:hypothetical protein